MLIVRIIVIFYKYISGIRIFQTLFRKWQNVLLPEIVFVAKCSTQDMNFYFVLILTVSLLQEIWLFLVLEQKEDVRPLLAAGF